jgi:hypothetical protein
MTTQPLIKKTTSASNTIDGQLKRNREMRDFAIAAEPSGRKPTTK